LLQCHKCLYPGSPEFRAKHDHPSINRLLARMFTFHEMNKEATCRKHVAIFIHSSMRAARIELWIFFAPLQGFFEPRGIQGAFCSRQEKGEVTILINSLTIDEYS
jgi:hypothetical protein